MLNLSDLVEKRIDADKFFNENFKTKGMDILFDTAFKRFQGKSDTGVIKLTQAMGGGKTHNMLALALLAENKGWRRKIIGREYDDIGDIKVVAFSGRESDAPFGIWGSIAEQLGKKEMFADLYSPLRAPGESAWIKLLQGENILILLDELPPYLENARSVTVGHSDLCKVTVTALANLFAALGKQQPQTRTLGRGTVRGLKVLMWTALTAVLVVALGLLLYFTPIMSARSIVVTGVGAVTQEEVVAAAAVAPGTPLLQVNTDGVAERVAGIRRIASARVQRQYPSTLRITVIERVPVVLKDYPDGVHLFDRDGVDFATAPPPPGIPYLDTENPGPSDPATQAALQVMTSLRPDVASQVGRVSAPSVAAITLTLVDGRTVVWGTTDRTEEKALKLAALLTQPGQVYDVSSPDLPTVK
ncbi:MAG: Cell division protein FtsQ [Firmicutes bacterium ADurb.Bin373]|nr:MAG: Cell division protein FtsQ [Firmicutes bacterium ADurb.Bin373]